MNLLRAISIASLIAAGVSALIILIDLLKDHKQKMAIMNWVWPITGVWAGPLELWAYFSFGRMSKNTKKGQDESGKDSNNKQDGDGEKSKEELEKRAGKPFWQITTSGTLHCASGCTLGDFVGEWIVFSTGLVIAGSVLWSDYLLDFTLAYIVGIVFQYFAIAPMRGLSGWPGILAAIKADTVSLVTFEIGMFAWMAFTHKILFKPALEPTQPAYWFMMQIAMLIGFLTAYPANWWLIRKGIKEAM